MVYSNAVPAPSLSRRDLLALALGLSAPRALRCATPDGKMKITGFTIHKATLRWRDLVFLEVNTDAGLTGLGEATLEGRAGIAEAALRGLEEDFIGRDPAGPEEHWNRAYYRLSRWRNGPAAMSAMSAVDIALWDLEAKRLGVPLWRLLGGRLRKASRVYYTHWGASIEDRRTPEAFRDWAVETRQQGWTAVKWTLAAQGTEPERIARSCAELEAIRAAVFLHRARKLNGGPHAESLGGFQRQIHGVAHRRANRFQLRACASDAFRLGALGRERPFDGRPTLLAGFYGPVAERFRRAPVFDRSAPMRVVNARCLPQTAAQQTPERHSEPLGLQVPQRDIDRRQRGH